MAAPVARKGDPISHGGQIIEGSATRRANGIEIARVGDAALCLLHGLVVITTGNPTWIADNGQPVARVGSQCSCGAVVTAGSPNVFSNN